MGSRKSKLIVQGKELTSEQVAEISRQTNLIDSEIRRRYLAFREQYPSGLITRKQFSENLNEVWPESRIDGFASHLFDLIDHDQNGTIDFEEFIYITHKLDSCHINEENDDNKTFLELLFDMFDRNHNGYLEKNELKPLVESIYDLSGLPEEDRHGLYSCNAQVKYLLKKLDKNHDKRLSKEEFIDLVSWLNNERIGQFLFAYYDMNNG